ncbi:MAG: DnaJ domain-containing protein [Parafilimonas sp.]
MITLTFAAMPATKDYYKILNVKSTASSGEIKNAFRLLAMKYHPDRNPGDALSTAVFTEAAEAYKVLSDADARKQYNYLRYLTADEEYQRPAETIETLINRITEINKRIKTADPFRLNKDALLYSIKQLFPDDISLLLRVDDNLLKQFLEMINTAAARLSSHQTKQLIILLQPVYKKQQWLQQQLNTIIRHQQKEERWEKNKIFLAVLIAILLCIIIFLSASK